MRAIVIDDMFSTMENTLSLFSIHINFRKSIFFDSQIAS